MTARPTLHIIAGPNGAGKTTLYLNRIKALTLGAEFINADLLALSHFGHPAETQRESEKGQALADERRRQLMASRKSFVTESTFSHPSKLELIDDARALGYRVVIYHVHVASAALSVLRVQARVAEGGHPVPEGKIRERFERNQTIIRQAVLTADHAYVFDNSQLDQPHRLIITIKKGQVTEEEKAVPDWAKAIYAAVLAT